MKTWKTRNGIEITRLIHGRSNVYLVRNDRKSLLVDSAVAAERPVLLPRIRKTTAGRGPDMIILTHTHFDHAGNVAVIRERYGCPVAVHATEAGYLREGYSPLPVIVSGPLQFLNRFDKNRLRAVVRTKPAEAGILVDEELDLEPDGIAAKIIHTPGHTAGSLTLVVDDEYALVGDNMVNIPWQRIFPPFCDDVPALLRTWERLLASPVKVFLPAHGWPFTHETLEASFIRHSDRWKQNHG